MWYHDHRISRCWAGEHPQRGAVPHPALRTRTCATTLGCVVRCGRTGLLGGTALSQALQTPSVTNRAPPPSKNQMPPLSHRGKKKKKQTQSPATRQFYNIPTSERAAVDERQAQQLVLKQRDTCRAVGKEDRWDVSL